ncbi:MAG: flagellar hook-length control protein FliK [Desulfonatronovibrionaceae bacterium]
MQFLPLNTQLDLLSSGSRERDFQARGDSFASDFDSFMRAGGREEDALASSSLDEARKAVSELEDRFAAWEQKLGPDNNDQSDHGSFLQEVVDREDFAALRGKLEEYGVSEEEILELEKKVADGELSWEGLLAELEEISAKESKVELAGGDKERIQVLLRQIGFSADEGREVLKQLESGDLDKAFSRIMAKLRDMSEDKHISVSERDFQALARAFGLKDPGFEFPYGQKGRLNQEQLQHILSSLKQENLRSKDSVLMQGLEELRRGEISARELLERLAQSGDKDKDSILEAAFKLAVKAKKEGKEFDSVEDKKNFYRAMADQEKDRNAKGKLGTDTRSEDKEAKIASESQGKRASETENAGKAVRDKVVHSDGEGKNSQSKGESAAAGDKKVDIRAGQNQGGGNEKEQNESRENAKSWKELLGKLKSSDDGSVKENNSSKQAFFQATNLNDVLESKQIKNPATGQKVPASRIMEQIQQGIFKNLGQGRSQMSLQLNPPQLGSISLILHVKNNEVQAMIKTTSHDVTHTVQENMAQLKSSLEQQGLRVNRMDVQTQLRQDSHLQDGNWQGTEQHNEARERLRRGGRMGFLRDLEEQGEEMVREVQMIKYGENISQSGLDMFA